MILKKTFKYDDQGPAPREIEVRPLLWDDLWLATLLPVAGGWLGWLITHSIEHSITLAIVFTAIAVLGDTFLPVAFQVWDELRAEGDAERSADV